MTGTDRYEGKVRLVEEIDSEALAALKWVLWYGDTFTNEANGLRTACFETGAS